MWSASGARSTASRRAARRALRALDAHPDDGQRRLLLRLTPRPGGPPDGNTPAISNHSNRMVVNEGAMATGVALHAAVALRFLDGTRGARPA